MLSLQSKKHTVSASPEQVLDYASSADQIKNLFPQEKLKSWKSSDPNFSFQLQGLPEITMNREKFESREIRFKAAPGSPVQFDLFVPIQSADDQTEFQFCFEGDINFGLQLMVKGPLQALMDHLASSLASQLTTPA